jgi:hypothetical protein
MVLIVFGGQTHPLNLIKAKQLADQRADFLKSRPRFNDSYFDGQRDPAQGWMAAGSAWRYPAFFVSPAQEEGPEFTFTPSHTLFIERLACKLLDLRVDLRRLEDLAGAVLWLGKETRHVAAACSLGSIQIHRLSSLVEQLLRREAIWREDIAQSSGRWEAALGPPTARPSIMCAATLRSLLGCGRTPLCGFRRCQLHHDRSLLALQPRGARGTCCARRARLPTVACSARGHRSPLGARIDGALAQRHLHAAQHAGHAAHAMRRHRPDRAPWADDLGTPAASHLRTECKPTRARRRLLNGPLLC